MSAEVVALARCWETQEPAEARLFTDPFAVHFLAGGARAAAALCHVAPLRALILGGADLLAPGARGFAVGRTRFIDDALRAALATGIDQIVLLGAGYDCRAYRMAEIGQTPVFEVDHPATQARKRAVLGQVLPAIPAHVRFVPIDFDRQRLPDALAAAGFEPRRRNFFIWEGVTEYLTAEAVEATLRFVVEVSAPRSELAFTYADVRLLDGTRAFPEARLVVFSNRRLGEPYRFGFHPDTLVSHLRERGLVLLDDIAGRAHRERYFAPRGRKDTAVEYEHTALARVADTRP